MNDFDVLVDSDAFVGFFLPDDAHHPRTTSAFEQFLQHRTRLVATDYIVAETATVLSRRSGQEVARQFLQYVWSGAMPIIHIDAVLHQAALKLFSSQSNKNTSVFDCSNVVVMQQFSIPQIMSFDQAYPKKHGLRLVS